MGKDSIVERASWLLEGSDESAYVTDPVGTIEYVNPAFEALTGYGEDEALGRTPAIVKSGIQPEGFYRDLWSTLHAGHAFHGVLVNRRRDGSLFHEEKTIRPLFDETGRIAHYLSCGRDVSERLDLLEQIQQPAPSDVSDAPLATPPTAVDAQHMFQGKLPLHSRRVHAGDTLYRAGERFRDLYIVRFGLCKLMSVTAEGHEELITMLFKGDWLGFDGLADGRHGCSAVAADTGEVWSVRYDALMQAGVLHPELLRAMHAAMARQHAREREAVMAMHSLPADGRVAAFLCRWADDLDHCGMRNDHITLPASRAEIGGHVGLRLESVSRAMVALERERLIRFSCGNRRNIEIPDLPALRHYVREASAGQR
ncbi:MAG TPA: PAS domain S-box protein [Rhizobacter sp.]|nr:PAS domain S-box protein [Rhizobacter sp.]